MSTQHHHHHHSHHHHGHEPGQDHSDSRPWWRSGRLAVAVIAVGALLSSACLLLVSPGQAVVISRFGNPVRVITAPGLASKLPAPIDSTLSVDLRLRTTSSGLHDVGTRDGL